VSLPDNDKNRKLTDSQMLDWLERNFDRADGERPDSRSATGLLHDYLVWGRRAGADGNLRRAIREAARGST
jgi:hypothetical protein